MKLNELMLVCSVPIFDGKTNKLIDEQEALLRGNERVVNIEVGRIAHFNGGRWVMKIFTEQEGE